MSAVSETFTIQQWSSGCGPQPVSGTLQAGGPVTVQTLGGELVISGGRRTLRTDQCLDPLPTLARDAHSSDGKSWRTRCSSPQSDPRHAAVNAAYFVTGDDTLSVAETGRYEFNINDAHCIADVKRAASLRRVVAAAATPSATSAPVAILAPTVAAPPPSPLALPLLRSGRTAAARETRLASRCAPPESSCASATTSHSEPSCSTRTAAPRERRSSGR